MRIAIVHEWLVTYAGSEKVLSAMLEEFPSADLFCVIDTSHGKYADNFRGKPFTVSSAQRLRPYLGSHRNMLPIMMFAIEQLDLRGYDLVISNSHAVAKGVITGPDQLHISYCYTPMRYAWDLQAQYLREQKLEKGLKGLIARFALHWARVWDVRTSYGVDNFIACSKYIARRIHKVYQRPSTVIYPGVDVDYYTPGGQKADYYVTSSRMVPYKKIPLIVEAFSRMPDKRLVVIGDGPQFKEAQSLASSNVSLLGYQGDDVLRQHLREAKAFIFAAEEDFGIAPIEAQACGTPVLAYGRGAASETVKDGVTGLHFWAQTVEAICDVVGRFEAMEQSFDKDLIRAHAETYSVSRFRTEFKEQVDRLWSAHQERLGLVLAQ